ncbi:MAG TPA: hypothetical protein PKH77_10185 [Anaerolineae bacterium]|nr:hypothetical protein [Anaerolineae bacterium]
MSDRLFSNPLQDCIILKNTVFDYLMPTLSGNAWKVLCVAIRQTLGNPPAASAPWVGLNELMQNSGIPERRDADKAVQECLYAGYLTEHPENADASQPRYALNLSFEAPSALIEEQPEPASSKRQSATAKSKPEAKSAAAPATKLPALSADQQSALEAVLAFGREMSVTPDEAQAREAVLANTAKDVTAWLELGHRMTNLSGTARFQTVLQRLLAKVPPMPLSMLADDDDLEDFAPPADLPEPAAPAGDASAEQLWEETLDALRPQMRSNLFKFFKPTRAIELTPTALVVAVPNTRTKDWLETGKVAETVQTAFSSSGGFGLKLEFVVEE